MSILGYPNLEPSELPQILVAGSSGIVTGWLSTKPGDITGANFLGGKMIFIRFHRYGIDFRENLQESMCSSPRNCG